jgi:hypothetical protein
MPIPGGFRGHIVVNAANAAGFADDAGGWGAYCRPYCTIPVTLPPTRIEVSVPGIKNDRGKLPADSGAPGAGAGLSWLWPSWSSRCWRRSLVARRSESSSAAAPGPPASSATSAIAPPIAVIVGKAVFRFMARDYTRITAPSRPLDRPATRKPHLRGPFQAGVWYDGSTSTGPSGRFDVEDREIRAALDRHWTASDANDFEAEHEIYREDAVLEYPQSGERIRGRRKIQSSRAAQPNEKRFTVRRIIGAGDLWVTEFDLTYDGRPSYTVSIMEFRGGKVARETQYFAEPFEPGPSRAQWVERIP